MFVRGLRDIIYGARARDAQYFIYTASQIMVKPIKNINTKRLHEVRLCVVFLKLQR